MHDDQIKLKREYDEAMGRENQGEDQGERIPSDSVKTQTTTTHLATHPFQTNIRPTFQTKQTIQPLLKNTQT